MIDVQNLTFGYPKTKKKVFDDFSLQVDKGMVCGLLGENGVGKTTLLYIMSGLLTPQSGKVLIDGIDVRKRKVETLDNLFIVPDEIELPQLTISDYVDFYSPFYSRFSEEDLGRYLDIFCLEEDGLITDLSLGQRKKFYMSFAFATNIQYLLMDEPTNGIDIPSKAQFRKFIAAGMSEEKTILIGTHQVRDIDKMLDHVMIITGNKLLKSESIVDSDMNLEQIFMDTISNNLNADENE
jgi:ABC-2 type transport system ATP-binding protein